MTTFYYSRCVEGTRWFPTGWLSVEPQKVFGQEPLGLEPDWCCDTFKRHFDYKTFMHTRISIGSDSPGGQPFVGLMVWDMNAGNTVKPELKYCPFCAAVISFQKNLDIRVVEEEVTDAPRIESHYEVVES